MFSFFLCNVLHSAKRRENDTTVGELRAALCELPPERVVTICADLRGEWATSFPGLGEQAVVFGYYAVDKVCNGEEVVLMTGNEVFL